MTEAPDFQRDIPIELGVAGAVDLAHATLTDLRGDFIHAEGFYKKPGIAETIDWGAALMALHKDELDAETVEETLGCIFKYNDDIESFRQGNLVALLEQADVNKSM